MQAVRRLNLKLNFVALTSKLAVLLMGATCLMSSVSRAGDIERAPSFSTRGEAKRIVIRNRVEVLQLRGARSNPNFLEQSFHDAEVKDVERWNTQNDNLTKVSGTKRKGVREKSRMPAGEFVKHSTPTVKTGKVRKVALDKQDF